MQDDCDPRASNPVRFLGRSLSLLPPLRVDNAARGSFREKEWHETLGHEFFGLLEGVLRAGRSDEPHVLIPLVLYDAQVAVEYALYSLDESLAVQNQPRERTYSSDTS